MNDLLNAIILGIVEGITEFLPISSTGHLIVAAELLGFKDRNGTFEIVIQLGAVLAVLWFYRRDIIERARAIASGHTARRFWFNLFIAFLPAAITGLLLEKYITAHLFSPSVVAASLIIGGIILWLIEQRRKSGTVKRVSNETIGLDNIKTHQALLIGIAQVAALVPGVSRSGASIVGGLLTGLDRETATAFSFYLALPTLGGATAYKLAKSFHQVAASGDGLNLTIGTVIAFLVALLSIGWLLRYVAHHDFRGFAIYRVLAGAILFAWLALR